MLGNGQIADLLRRYAAVLVLEGADRFKIKAFRRAADTIDSLATDVASMVARGEDLQQLPGVGKAISQSIEEFIQTGTLPRLERAIAQFPAEQIELSAYPRLDPKTVMRVYRKLKINSIDQLRQCLESGEVQRALGSRTEFHVRQGLDQRPRMLLYDALPLAQRIEEYLKSIPGVVRVSQTGSLRRRQDTVGDLNFLVAAKTAISVFRRFSEFGGSRSAEKLGPRKMLYKLSSGVGVSVQWTPPKEWGLALVLATGSASHLEDLGARAATKKLALTAPALARRKIDASDETAVYRRLGLEFVEPELREGRGEVQAAEQRRLPALVQQSDIKGDLHMHTISSDGAHTIQQMIDAARQRGYQYIAITDHSQSLKITNGLSEKRLLQQIKAIDKLNARLDDFVILKSAEVDILEDGTLDYSNTVLKALDFTICSIHSRFALNKQQQTERILRAMDNRYFTILGHATGRLLLKREGYELDMERVLERAKSTGCFVEINSSPDRLDLSDEHAKLAKELGVKIAINTDAHSIAELDFLQAGIHQARRAWLQPHDVLNTLSTDELCRLLGR